MEGRKGEMDGIQIIYNWDLLPDAVRIVLKCQYTSSHSGNQEEYEVYAPKSFPSSYAVNADACYKYQ